MKLMQLNYIFYAMYMAMALYEGSGAKAQGKSLHLLAEHSYPHTVNGYNCQWILPLGYSVLLSWIQTFVS